VIATKRLPDEELAAFRLKVRTDVPEGGCQQEISRAQFEYAVDDAAYGAGTMRLRDRVSGDFVHPKGPPEPANARSWSPEGRYLAYAEQNQVVIWKLCASWVCNFKK
jgi:hypothetical protein